MLEANEVHSLLYILLKKLEVRSCLKWFLIIVFWFQIKKAKSRYKFWRNPMCCTSLIRIHPQQNCYHLLAYIHPPQNCLILQFIVYLHLLHYCFILQLLYLLIWYWFNHFHRLDLHIVCSGFLRLMPVFWILRRKITYHKGHSIWWLFNYQERFRHSIGMISNPLNFSFLKT